MHMAKINARLPVPTKTIELIRDLTKVSWLPDMVDKATGTPNGEIMLDGEEKQLISQLMQEMAKKNYDVDFEPTDISIQIDPSGENACYLVASQEADITEEELQRMTGQDTQKRGISDGESTPSVQK